MTEKNADRLSNNLHDMLATCGEERTKALFPVRDERAISKARDRDLARRDRDPNRVEISPAPPCVQVTTVGEKFRTQLTKLMATVGKTKPFFIRCVKPNHVRAAHRFETKLAVEQLTYAGVFEAVTIRKKGYPFRCTHAQFAAKYRWITRKADGWAPINVNPNGAPKDYCVAVLGSVVQDFSAVQVGVTLMLYRADEHRVLELLKNLALGRCFQHFQAAFRRKMGRVYRGLLRQVRSRSRM